MNKENEYLRELDPKELKRNARRILSRQGAMLKLVFAALILASLFVMLEYLLSYAILNPIYMLFPTVNELLVFAVEQVYFVLEMLVLSPLLMGFYSLTIGIASGEDPGLSHIFGYYRSFMRMCRSFVASLTVILPIKVFILLTELGFELLFAYREALGGLLHFALCAAYVVILSGIFVLGLFLCGRFYPFIYAAICSEDRKLSSSFKDSLRSTHGQLGKIFALRIGFFPLILLSIASVGVLFIIYTIPYMAASYSLYSSYLLTGKYKNHNSEDFQQ